jgi:hypothetical protein
VRRRLADIQPDLEPKCRGLFGRAALAAAFADVAIYDLETQNSVRERFLREVIGQVRFTVRRWQRCSPYDQQLSLMSWPPTESSRLA